MERFYSVSTDGIEVKEISLSQLLADDALDKEVIFRVFGLTECQPLKLVVNNSAQEGKKQ